ncbi:MAG: 16S rRNA (guanine(966)-N(2))-methyltransferase RsmD [Marivibrio sp.]|uniref:16S rRNA (guanine(966)-N(2))-methyltransferase RsmD n=1 Tax=Marivibrio sp. TaxID=2039719 RepID=UPI0032EE9627
MRIVAGRLRNQRLDAPPGKATRPTAERVRESLFNILENGRFRGFLTGAPVLDLFAGSGAVGLEALSRGAARAYLIETDRAALRTMEDNIRRLGLDQAARVVKADATKPPAAAEACALVFLDPPYGEGLAEPALAGARAMGWLDPEGIAAVQLHPKDAFTPPDGLVVIDERRYGAARLVLLESAEGGG